MNKWKAFAVLFTVISFGAIQDTFRIFTASDADIAENRGSLMPMAVIITGLFIFLSIKFWIKSSKE